MTDSENLPPNLTDTLLENASGPKKVTTDAGTVEQHPLGDLIEADRYVKSTEAAKTSGLGIKLTKLSPDVGQMKKIFPLL